MVDEDGPVAETLTSKALQAGGTGRPMIELEGVEKWFGDFQGLGGWCFTCVGSSDRTCWCDRITSYASVWVVGV
jgi:hypothetical protein